MTQQATARQPACAPSPAQPRRSPGGWTSPIPSVTADSDERFLGFEGRTPATQAPDLTQILLKS